MSKWKEQLNRVQRWYHLFELINIGIEHDKNSEFYKDIVYSFFINCYHLKDWIKNDSSLSIVKQDIEDFIDNNDCMCICADICNGLKHLSNRNRSKQNPEMTSVHHRIEISIKGQIYGAKYDILTSHGVKDAFVVATECKEKWEEFISNEIKLK